MTASKAEGLGRRFIFVGVTTAESSMVRIFPRWRSALGLPDDVELVGRDFPLHAPAADYRALVAELKADPHTLGGLVTTHKIDLYSASHDLFDAVDHDAELLGEVSCIARRGERLLGWAKDPLAAGRALDGILRSRSLGRAGAEVLCFGAGGAGHAITLYMLTRLHPDDRPRRLVIADPDEERLGRLRALHQHLDADTPIEYIRTDDPERGTHLVAGLSAGSLVINASGMGKDRPGSPVSDDVRFPRGGIAWELNYRGTLRFLYQAWEQREERQVTVADGWEYFILGWATVMEEVFQRPINDRDLAELTREAAFARPTLPTSSV